MFQMYEVLFLVSGKIPEVSEQKRVHRGKYFVSVIKLCSCSELLAAPCLHFTMVLVFVLDCSVWEELLRVSEKRVFPAHEKHCEVSRVAKF